MTSDYETVKMYGTRIDVTTAAYYCARGMVWELRKLAERVAVESARPSDSGSNALADDV